MQGIAIIGATPPPGQRQLPLIMLGAGRPPARGNLGRARAYAEPLFDFPEVGSLSPDDARRAIAKPAAADALDAVVAQTRRYPYFLPEWGK